MIVVSFFRTHKLYAIAVSHFVIILKLKKESLHDDSTVINLLLFWRIVDSYCHLFNLTFVNYIPVPQLLLHNTNYTEALIFTTPIRFYVRICGE